MIVFEIVRYWCIRMRVCEYCCGRGIVIRGLCPSLPTGGSRQSAHIASDTITHFNSEMVVFQHDDLTSELNKLLFRRRDKVIKK